ncbi:hypothetical protein K504DRAFT_462591 [Pleomassaria siparia CBS 279.74]|uniref:Cupredoxin n=1 Tax=Pleomassaria siparia CBS 279.74 TaxID=1314801 RepID=A0A6G1KMU0_9PLEO|nr:hypothetical protein K504DRAFT_462591 [Pleomassaria siparia CBS 279.74]
MVAFTSILVAATAVLGFVSAAPSAPPPTGVIHRIFAGSTVDNKGLHFEPENVVAEIGDLIEVHFLPKNHTFTQASFDKPCEPLAGGIFSGFNFATAAGESKDVFTFTIENKEPLWYYCSQIVGGHCQTGMTGVINQNFDSANTLAAFKAKAVGTVTKQPSVNALDSQGGSIVPNQPL